MERVLVVVFDNEAKAFEADSALRQLDIEGSIAIYESAIVAKSANGSISIKPSEGAGPIRTLIGTSIGSIIGLLGGPAGIAIGAVSGLTLGALADLENAGVGEDFLEDVSRTLTAGKVALVAEIDEEWTTPVDTRMEAIGGTVLRRSLHEVRKRLREEYVAAAKSDLVQMKEEIKKVHADRRAKMQKAIDELQAKVHAQEKKLTEQRQSFEQRQKAKAEVLKRNAAVAARALKDLGKTPV